MPARTLNDFFVGFFYAGIRDRQEVALVIPCTEQGNDDEKKIEVEGDKGKEAIVHYGIVPRNEKHGMMTIFHVTGTRLIRSRKEK